MKFPEPQLTVEHIDEPALEFAFGQRTAHPKDGLFLCGPHGQINQTTEIRVGVIGDKRSDRPFQGLGQAASRTY